jgi:hypothetical protein
LPHAKNVAPTKEGDKLSLAVKSCMDFEKYMLEVETRKYKNKIRERVQIKAK